MAARTLPGLGLRAFYNPGEDGWGDAMSQDLRVLSALVQARVLSRTVALPGSPTDGDIYIAPSGDPQAGKIALRDNGEWVYVTAQQGWVVFVVDANAHYKFTGTTWALLIGDSAATDAASVTYTAPTGSDASTVAEALDELFGNTGGVQPYDPAFFLVGGVADQSRTFTIVVTRACSFPAGLTASRGYAATPADQTAGVDIGVHKNGVSVGTVSFASGSNTATFAMASETAFAAGDRLSLVTPADLDTLADISITLAGTRV